MKERNKIAVYVVMWHSPVEARTEFVDVFPSWEKAQQGILHDAYTTGAHTDEYEIIPAVMWEEG